MIKRLLPVSAGSTLNASELKPSECRWPERSSPAPTGCRSAAGCGLDCAERLAKAAAGNAEAADLRNVRRAICMFAIILRRSAKMRDESAQLMEPCRPVSGDGSLAQFAGRAGERFRGELLNELHAPCENPLVGILFLQFILRRLNLVFETGVFSGGKAQFRASVDHVFQQRHQRG